MVRKFSRAAALGTGATLLLVGLAACGTDTNSAAAGNELTYWSSWKEGEPQQKALAGVLAEFTQKTGVKVNVQWQGRDVMTKLQPTLNGMPAADLVDTAINVVQSKVPPGAALDLTPVLATKVDGEALTVGEIIPADTQKAVTVEGKMPLLPYQLTCNSMWYNGAEHPELADKAPATWGEFKALLDKEKAQGKAPLALDADIPGYSAYYFTGLSIGKLGGGSFHRAAGDKTGAEWDNPAYLKSAQQVEELAKGGYFIKGYNASKFPALQQKWANNEAAFIMNGSWLPSETKPYLAPGFQARSFAFPGDTADALAPVACNAAGWVIPAKAKSAAAAQKLVAFLYGKKHVQSIVDATGSLSVRQDITPSPLTADVSAIIKTNGTIPNYDGVIADYSEWWTKVFLPLDDKLVTGRVDAKTFMSELKAQSIDYWKRA